MVFLKTKWFLKKTKKTRWGSFLYLILILYLILNQILNLILIFRKVMTSLGLRHRSATTRASWTPSTRLASRCPVSNPSQKPEGRQSGQG